MTTLGGRGVRPTGSTHKTRHNHSAMNRLACTGSDAPVQANESPAGMVHGSWPRTHFQINLVQKYNA